MLYTTFWNVSSSFVPVFLIVFAAGNFLGPLLLGRLFDTVGRKPMIAGTYLGSAAVAALGPRSLPARTRRGRGERPHPPRRPRPVRGP